MFWDQHCLVEFDWLTATSNMLKRQTHEQFSIQWTCNVIEHFYVRMENAFAVGLLDFQRHR